MKIFGLPIIKYDECLTSWLVRSANSIDECGELQYVHSLADPDFDLANDKVLGFLSRLGMGGEAARSCFGARTTWLLPWEKRTAYCLLCLQEDVSAGGSPYWRKAWCYLHCPICVKHGRLLDVADPLSIGPQKSWGVFIDECNRQYNENISFEIFWKRRGRVDVAVMLALIVQDFLVRAHKANYVRLRGLDVAVSGVDILAVARLLFESFLFPRLRPPCGDGIAREMQIGLPRTGGITSVEEARKIGCSDCNTYSRMTALVLIGCVFKLFPLARFNGVRRLFSLTINVYSGEAYDIGRHGMRLSSWKEHELTIEFLNGLPEGLKGRLGEFIYGLKNIVSDAILG
ncbi:TniQ family protein [Pseudomonas chengduensis]|nr:hypothetical protein [Pseudomonas chengduensis]MDH1728146.1 TniQ family protein [Pseudomonas chengduensis]